MSLRANVRKVCWAALALSAALVAVACDESKPAGVAPCQPVCEQPGALDGCGGTCPQEPGSAVEDDDTPDACASGSCVCTPRCDGTRCDDGCGGSCSCVGGDVCDAQGSCVAESACTQSCAEAGFKCGELCGESCGSCGGESTCLAGTCVPKAGCNGCSLSLSALQMQDREGEPVVWLAVDYHAKPGEPRPRMADLRLRVDRAAELLEVYPGEALLSAEKTLYVDPATNKAFKRRADGSFQLLLHAFANTEDVPDGRLLTLKFKLEGPGEAAFSLVRKVQVFAPAGADAALQASAYDAPVVVAP